MIVVSACTALRSPEERADASCVYGTSMCNPTRTWVVAPPGVNYYCASGAVSISFGTLMFDDTGTTLSVWGGGINCTMFGTSARVSRMIDVSCVLLGGCIETYHLVETFTSDMSWTGTFTAEYSGGGCYGCVTQTFTGLTGTR